MANNHPKIIPQDKALDFILGGNSIFTVESGKTKKRFTYKVLGQDKTKSLRVMVLVGPDNTSNYKHIGDIVVDNFMPLFKPGPYSRDRDYTIAFEFIFLNLCIKLNMPTLNIWHNGRCCRCGRLLTVPESIAMGIGPECIFKTNFFNSMVNNEIV